MRLRAILSPAAGAHVSRDEQSKVICHALDELQRLSTLFDKLLHIAEIESGVQRQNWHTLDVYQLLADVTELYEPLAAEQDKNLTLVPPPHTAQHIQMLDRKSTRLNSSHVAISYAVF